MCPNPCSFLAQWWALPHASIPTRHGSSLAKNDAILSPLTCSFNTVLPLSYTPCAWIRLFAKSMPTVVIVISDAPFIQWLIRISALAPRCRLRKGASIPLPPCVRITYTAVRQIDAFSMTVSLSLRPGRSTEASSPVVPTLLHSSHKACALGLAECNATVRCQASAPLFQSPRGEPFGPSVQKRCGEPHSPGDLPG